MLFENQMFYWFSFFYSNYMNIHPLFVHFPIAFLMGYVVFEWLPQKKLQKFAPKIQTIKIALLLLGVLSGFVALMTGELAEELVGEHPVVELHSFFATLTIAIFAVLSVAILWPWTRASLARGLSWLPGSWLRAIDAVTRVIVKRPIVLLLSLAGFVTLLITGALGGAMVYGPEVDPVVSFVYSLFF